MPRLWVIVLSLLLIFSIQSGERISASDRKETFIHRREGYLLNKDHRANGCVSCHPKAQGRRRRGGCGSCHDYRHDLPKGVTCTTCHTIESFSQIKNYRHLLNDFFRVGVHKTLSCRECHPNGQFKGNPRECVHCHMERRQDAPHGLKLGGDCQECHTPNGWQPVKHQHSGFTLRAAHRNLHCLDCHPDYTFEGVQSFCYSCHKREFHGGAGLDHAAAGLPYDCLLCHTMYSFSPPASYRDHPSGLISEGNHHGAACRDCHKKAIFQGLSDECQSCHQKDYASTASPNHAQNGFSLDCTVCHDPKDPSWESGGKNHTWWPLRGMHKTLDCSECHGDGVYAGKSTDCLSCHQADYAGTTDPDHQAAGYPTGCDQCHQDSHTSWEQVIFDHPLPLTSNHAGIACTECHKEPANYAVFVCTDCHLRQNTNFIHRGIAGYNYASESCYGCHPQGQR
ncbi:MAG: cytochrome c3 family protein [bacterium]